MLVLLLTVSHCCPLVPLFIFSVSLDGKCCWSCGSCWPLLRSHWLDGPQNGPSGAAALVCVLSSFSFDWAFFDGHFLMCSSASPCLSPACDWCVVLPSPPLPSSSSQPSFYFPFLHFTAHCTDSAMDPLPSTPSTSSSNTTSLADTYALNGLTLRMLTPTRTVSVSPSGSAHSSRSATPDAAAPTVEEDEEPGAAPKLAHALPLRVCTSNSLIALVFSTII